MTLTGFLLARIVEDEAIARSNLRADASHRTVTSEIVAELSARLLAGRERDRRIVDEHPRDDRGFCGDNIGLVGCKWLHPCPTLRHMATVYADHPDYRAEWKP